jgi:predicted component of type VI protein secretion system
VPDLVLEIVEGADAGKQLPLETVVDIGREPSFQLSLAQDSQVSRRHARVLVQGGTAVVEDLGSTNGTYVNDQPIHAPRPIYPGDRIRVGLTVIELRDRAQVRERPSAVQPVPQVTAIGAAVLAPVPEQQLASVPAVSPQGSAGAPYAPPPPVPTPPPPQQAPAAFGGVGFRAPETPPGFVPPEVIGNPEAESDYRAIARMLDQRVKAQRNVAAFAMLSAAAIAVIIYFGLS